MLQCYATMLCYVSLAVHQKSGDLSVAFRSFFGPSAQTTVYISGPTLTVGATAFQMEAKNKMFLSLLPPNLAAPELLRSLTTLNND